MNTLINRKYDDNTQICWTFEEAQQQGMLSRSRWREQGRIVPEDARPTGVVVRETGKRFKEDGAFIYPVVSQDDEFLILASKWFDVFCLSQTVSSKKETLQESSVNTVSSIQHQEINTREGVVPSSMNGKKTEAQTAKTFTTNGTGSDNCSINNVRAYVPEGLVLPDDCPVKREIWWFLGLIYWKHLEQRLPWDQAVNLKYEYLHANIPRWPEVWRTCQQLELVGRNSYSPGEKSYGYWTQPPFQTQTHRLRFCDHKVLSQKLRLAKQSHESRPVLKYLSKQLERLTIEMRSFDENFRCHPNRQYYHAHLQTFVDRFFRFSKDEFAGRVHTNVTNLYSPLRALLRVDGENETLGETDIRNSQPLFAGIAAKRQGCADERYMKLCESGDLYDHLANRIGVLRETAKSEMMLLFFAKNKYRSPLKRLFEAEFPSMAEYIVKMKEKDHTRVARQMQLAERKFVIDNVCAELNRRQKGIFITTIHDSVLARKEDCDLVLNVFREQFRRLGVNPTLAWNDVAKKRER